MVKNHPVITRKDLRNYEGQQATVGSDEGPLRKFEDGFYLYVPFDNDILSLDKTQRKIKNGDKIKIRGRTYQVDLG